MTDLHASALWYIEQGIPVFPCSPGDKAPAIPSPHPKGSPERSTCKGDCGLQGHGVLDATTDRAQINQWWTRTPNANIGLRTGVVFDVLDIDDWANVNADVEAIIEEGFGFVATPRGGTHIYLSVSGDGNAANVVPGVDFRGQNGYVLAPPSTLPNGRYWWLEPVDFKAVAVAA